METLLLTILFRGQRWNAFPLDGIGLRVVTTRTPNCARPEQSEVHFSLAKEETLVSARKNGSAQTQYVIQLILAVQLLRVFIDTGSHTEFVL